MNDESQLAPVLVDAIRDLRLRAEMISVALALVAARDGEIRHLRRANADLRDELRRYTAAAVLGRAA